MAALSQKIILFIIAIGGVIMIKLDEKLILTPTVEGLQLLCSNRQIILYIHENDENKTFSFKDEISSKIVFLLPMDYNGFVGLKTKEFKEYYKLYVAIKEASSDKIKSRNIKGIKKYVYENIFKKLLEYAIKEKDFNQDEILSQIDDDKNKSLVTRINSKNKQLSSTSRILDLAGGFKIDYRTEYAGLGGLRILAGRNEDGEPEYELIGRLIIKEITMITDKLNIGLKPVYNMKYYNMVSLKDMELYHLTRDELANALYEDMCFIGKDLKDINKLISRLFISNANLGDSDEEPIFKSETDVFKDGFYYNNGKVLSNNILNDIKPTEENVRAAINLVNALITDRGTAKGNECNIFRFMLWSPFSWCFKEIGMNKACYGLVLEGMAGTNKTGAVANFSYLYATPDDIIQTADTVSSFGTRLEENTLPLMLDESRILFDIPDMEEIQKRNIWNKQTRSTKKRTGSNKDLDNFIALRMPVYALNNAPRFKPEFLRRYKINSYDKTMIITEKDEKEFIKKYMPGNPNTPLMDLKYLGKAFADRLIPYIEKGSNEIYDIEKLTVKILKEISEWCDTVFAPSIYEIQDSADGLAIDEYSLIQRELSKEFRKVRKISYGFKEYHEEDFIFCADNNEISWLHHKEINDKNYFAIAKKEFEEYIGDICSRKISASDILDLMGIELDTDINPDGFNTVFYSGKTIRGFKLTSFQLIYKLFGMNVVEHKNLIENEENENTSSKNENSENEENIKN